jgi:hypothetical protein
MSNQALQDISKISITTPLVEIAVEKMSPEYLNNFFCVVPGGFYRTQTVQNVFKAGETFGDVYRRTSTASGLAENAELHGYSEKKLDMTPSTFFALIDDAIESAGISHNDIIVLQKTVIAAGSDFRTRHALLTELHNHLFKAYLILRLDGFSHRDLVG